MASCSICSAAPSVQKAVNESLAAKEKLRDLSKRSGFSRAALSRHSRKCVRRAVIAEHASRIFNPAKHRIRVVFEHQELTDFRDGDYLVVVTYEKFQRYDQSYDQKNAEKNPRPPQPALEPSTAAPTESQPSEAIEQEKIVPQVPEPSETTAVETASTPCAHVFRNVAGDLLRCIHCGAQSERPKVIGVSRDFVAEQRDPMSRFNGLLKKFGH